jgi:hypothetical protein
MKPKLTIYVTDAELTQFRREAQRRRLSLSRYLKEHFLPTEFDRVPNGAVLGPETEKRLADAVRRAAEAHSKKMLDQISTLIVMVDQLAARTLGEAHHSDWQHEVEALVGELRGDAEPAANGARA